MYNVYSLSIQFALAALVVGCAAGECGERVSVHIPAGTAAAHESVIRSALPLMLPVGC